LLRLRQNRQPIAWLRLMTELLLRPN